MDPSQYAELFLTESREHVSAINQWLLELERGGATGSAEAVSAIFRAVHTVKGMSATMGYTVVAELSHELETLLDRVRRGELAVSGDLMDVLFRAADVLEGAIEAAVKGGGEQLSTADVLRRLRALAETQSPSASTAPLAAAGGWTVAAPPGPGTLVRVRLSTEAALKGVRAFLVVQAIRRLGDVLVVAPPIAALQSEQFEHDFALRLATSAPRTDIERAARGAGDVAAIQVGDDSGNALIPAGGAEDAADDPLVGSEDIPGATGEFLAPQVALGSGASRAETPAPAAAPNGPAAAAPRAIDVAATGAAGGLRQQRHVRIDLRRLDSLMNLIGELVITRGRLMQIAAGLDDPSLGESVTQASRLIGDLRDEIMTSRMVPVWQVFDRFPRLVRDASRTLGKRIEFTIEGKDIELDRSMLDEIGDPIVHLLRNAVDHGIESPERRTAAGKPPAGKLFLSASRDRSAVVVRVSDDGRGIDRDRVLARAKVGGLVDASKTELSDEELLRLIARPGFSTAERITDLSGRGVGIDAVYARVRALGGAVDIRSSPGQGTTVTLRLPLTLAIVRSLLARVADETYAIPLTHVSETVELHAQNLRTLQGSEVLILRSDVLPVLRLRDLVGLERRTEAEAARAGHQREQVVIIDLPDRRAGLVVDELTAQQEIVVKQYDGVKHGLSFFGGATILGNGSPALIVDVSSLP
jgi:two-component system chemotaxis sensor kinase CheA